MALSLSSTSIADLRPLAGLYGLRTLDLAHTKVADLTPLSGLTNLYALDIAGTRVTPAQVSELKKRMPNLKLVDGP
jgi:internalin A